jgi:hypothetical protein
MTDNLDIVPDGSSTELEHLDITSYLCPPNRINSCNKHGRTAYLIFTDFSDMGWLKELAALYNLATESVDKIAVGTP